jgi:hypothetical protein
MNVGCLTQAVQVARFERLAGGVRFEIIVEKSSNGRPLSKPRKGEEENSDADAERGESAGVGVVMGGTHDRMIVKPGCGEKKKI